MGFHIRCSGAEFLKQLARNPDDLFLGEPYALYFVALCTSIDDTALKWLYEHQLALDSLTGPYAAFSLFYNEATLRGDPFPAMWSPAVRGTYEAVVPHSLLRQGEHAVDEALRYQPDYRMAEQILIRSTVYASDAIARELELIDSLP